MVRGLTPRTGRALALLLPAALVLLQPLIYGYHHASVDHVYCVKHGVLSHAVRHYHPNPCADKPGAVPELHSETTAAFADAHEHCQHTVLSRDEKALTATVTVAEVPLTRAAPLILSTGGTPHSVNILDVAPKSSPPA